MDPLAHMHVSTPHATTHTHPPQVRMLLSTHLRPISARVLVRICAISCSSPIGCPEGDCLLLLILIFIHLWLWLIDLLKSRTRRAYCLPRPAHALHMLTLVSLICATHAQTQLGVCLAKPGARRPMVLCCTVKGIHEVVCGNLSSLSFHQ